MVKLTSLILVSISLCGHNLPKNEMSNQINDRDFEDVSSIISPNEFEQIKNFILENGDRQTYRNFDNNNPHYNFKAFDVYLASDIGQRNINNDPQISDFNQLTIHAWHSKIDYYILIVVREGDLKESKEWIRNGMEEGRVYLLDVYGEGFRIMKKNLPGYLERIKEEMKF